MATSWRNNLNTEDIVNSANREILEYLLIHSESATESFFEQRPDDLPEGLYHHLEFLRGLALNEPEIPAKAVAGEFDRLVLKIRERNAIRKQSERAVLLAEGGDARMPELESAALNDLADMHQAKTELGRRTLLARS